MFKVGDMVVGMARNEDGELNPYAITSEGCIAKVTKVELRYIEIVVYKPGKAASHCIFTSGVNRYDVRPSYFTRYIKNKGRYSIG